MDIQQALTWIVTGIGITGFLIVGRKVWWGWYVNLACQAIWYAYAIVSEQPAFLVAASFYTGVFALNAYKWTKEHRGNVAFIKHTKKHEYGTYTLPSGVKVTYTNLDNDSNLVKHARFELERIGEQYDTIEAYLDVIRAFSKMGHSGSSAAFATPIINDLMQFKPLSPLTNDPEEWHFHGEDVWGAPGGVWQNRRDGGMFSNDGGLTYTDVDDPKDDDGKKPVYCSQITHPVPA